jgi:hypothetical protein
MPIQGLIDGTIQYAKDQVYKSRFRSIYSFTTAPFRHPVLPRHYFTCFWIFCACLAACVIHSWVRRAAYAPQSNENQKSNLCNYSLHSDYNTRSRLMAGLFRRYFLKLSLLHRVKSSSYSLLTRVLNPPVNASWLMFKGSKLRSNSVHFVQASGSSNLS